MAEKLSAKPAENACKGLISSTVSIARLSVVSRSARRPLKRAREKAVVITTARRAAAEKPASMQYPNSSALCKSSPGPRRRPNARHRAVSMAASSPICKPETLMM